MSAYSTLTVSRSAALKALNKNFTNEELGDLLDVVLKDRLYNAIVVNDGSDQAVDDHVIDD
jgi:hypothetical protein